MAKQPDLAAATTLPLARTIERNPGQLPGQSTALRLLSVLQTTLDSERLLVLFDQELRAVSGYDGLNYRHGATGLQIQLGPDGGRYRSSYRLSLGDENLGELTISRHSLPAGEEERLLETLLSMLLYPLRNCLAHRAALARASRDALTGLSNRTALEETLAREVELCSRHDDQLAVIVLDLDNFKQINDQFGHQAGDRALMELADLLRLQARQSDQLFRYAGDEFVIVMSRTSAEGAVVAADRIRRAVACATVLYQEQPLFLSVSVGLAMGGPGDDTETLFRRADEALFCAKKQGRNRTVLAD